MHISSTPAAILTGDLIGSRSAAAGATDASLAALARTADGIGAEFGYDPRFTRSRGDAWQVYLPDPRNALYATLTLLAGLRAADTGLDTRLSVGIGPVDSLGSRDLSDGAGAAFLRSGDGLEMLGTARRLLLTGTGVMPCQQAIFDLVDWIAQGWTATQAEAVLLQMLHPELSNSARAERLGITRQAYEARLKGSGHGAWQGALGAFAGHDFGAAR